MTDVAHSMTISEERPANTLQRLSDAAVMLALLVVFHLGFRSQPGRQPVPASRWCCGT